MSLAGLAGKLKAVARAAAAEPGATLSSLVEHVVLACEACKEEDIAANQVRGAGRPECRDIGGSAGQQIPAWLGT